MNPGISKYFLSSIQEERSGLLVTFGLCFLSLPSVGVSEMIIETASSPGPFRNTQMSKAAQTHKLRKLRAPSKCRECDGLVVFHGAECEEVNCFFSPSCFKTNGTKRQP